MYDRWCGLAVEEPSLFYIMMTDWKTSTVLFAGTKELLFIDYHKYKHVVCHILIEKMEERLYRAFSYDITEAILMFQNKETAAILVYQAIIPRIKLYFYAKIVFCFGKPIWPSVTWV